MKKWLLAPLLFSVLYAGRVLQETWQNKVRTHELEYENLPAEVEGFSIFFITDIHRRRVSPALFRQLERKPDLIIIGGDLTELGVPAERVRQNLRLLRSHAPVVFVWGNHDLQVGRRWLRPLLHQEGIEIIEKQAYTLKESDFTIASFGEERFYESYRNPALVPEADLLIAHNPEAYYRYGPFSERAVYMLTGHTHGGQIRLFGWGPKLKGGWYSEQNQALFISNGYGTTSIPMRHGAPAETHLFVLTNSHFNSE
ncbi:metallophosphoesterase [Marinococcus luteus]|uniref:metallophosphoesterase n=1 Tax=Marinococcus luteus TaxID=1122204 RepID=UPI002ACC77E0|nr:metallophosphoesterase [Marinococcus luteus]MDZ5782335.1 metallophosphoesterase [Marinococcus luteus]